jgi:hypothetical protein
MAPPRRLRNGSLIALALVILPAAIVFWIESTSKHRVPASPAGARPPSAASAPPATDAETPAGASSTDPVRPPPPAPVVVRSPDPGRSPLADQLNAPDGDIQSDIAILDRVLDNYRLALGGNPVGNNREITAQLSGRNSRRHAPLPKDHPAISATGELLDRWGTPFFFHALSARGMEIRSAGPDRAMYTDDDVIRSPVPKNAEN